MGVGDQLRQLGKDISGAITAKPRADLMVAQEKYKFDEEQKIRDAKSKAAEMIGQKFGAEGQALYEAGESIASISKMLRGGGRSGGGRRGGGSNGGFSSTTNAGSVDYEGFIRNVGGPKDWGKDWMDADKVTAALGKQFSAGYDAYGKASKAGDVQGTKDAMELINSTQKGIESIKTFYGKFNKVKPTTARDVEATERFDKLTGIMAKMESEEANLLGDAISERFEKEYDAKGVTWDSANLYDEKHNIDLSGVPTKGSLNRYAVKTTLEGNYPPELAASIVNSNDKEFLKVFLDDPSVKKQFKIMSASRLKQLMAVDHVVAPAKDENDMPVYKNRLTR